MKSPDGLFTKSSQSMLVIAVIARVGFVAGTSILIAIFGFPFFVFVLVAELTKLIPFFSKVVINSSVCEISEFVSSESPQFSAQQQGTYFP